MKTIKSQTYDQFISQKTHCPKCNAQQSSQNVLNPSNPTIYKCNCGNQFNPDNQLSSKTPQSNGPLADPHVV